MDLMDSIKCRLPSPTPIGQQLLVYWHTDILIFQYISIWEYCFDWFKKLHCVLFGRWWSVNDDLYPWFWRLDLFLGRVILSFCKLKFARYQDSISQISQVSKPPPCAIWQVVGGRGDPLASDDSPPWDKISKYPETIEDFATYVSVRYWKSISQISFWKTTTVHNLAGGGPFSQWWFSPLGHN